MQTDTPQTASASPSCPLFRLGFRPFYLLAAAFAVISVPAWLAHYYGLSGGLLRIDLYWHAHEMVFGFVLAVVIGFLYTAARNWTGLWTPRGGTLAVIAGLWLAGRVAMAAADPALAAIVDFAFLPAAVWPLHRVLRQSGNRRNMPLVAVLALLGLTNGLYHLARLGWLYLSPVNAIQTAILLVVLIETIIAGRVIPAFTANALKQARPVVRPRLDDATLALTALSVAAWVVGLAIVPASFLYLATAAAHAVRLAGWKPAATSSHPLLWILHLAYAWIPVGFVLLWLSLLDVVTSSTAFHALAVGSMAGLIMGMMTRTALGHTGRPLAAGPAETVMYGLILLAALARLGAALTAGWLRDAALVLAMLGWCGAFVLYLVVYGPYLTRTRLDGKDG